MRREFHVRFCEGVGVRFPRATRLVACFQMPEDAAKFQVALTERLGRFGLEIEPTKTKMLEFGREAEANATARGTRPETFDFLGFTHYCGKTKDGKRFRVRRVTSARKFRAKLAAFKQWLKQVRTRPTPWIWAQVCAKLRGHYAYYGVTDNLDALRRFAFEVEKLLRKWLNRRGGRRSLNWDKFKLMRKRFPLPRPRITVNLYARW
jgi:RNA-directed DNA polymerase